jgi:hypothetical protein
MQISRHWRLNPIRYRLQGVRYENGVASLQNRPQPLAQSTPDMRETSEHTQVQVEIETETRQPAYV